jgi:hypothetical protein
MMSGLAKRILRLEKLAAKRTEEPKLCNCKLRTLYHTADCLEATLKRVSPICPLHGFRQFLNFWGVPVDDLLMGGTACLSWDANEYCWCPPRPPQVAITFDPNAPEDTWEVPSPEEVFNREEESRRVHEEESRRLDAIIAKYRQDREDWVKKTGRRLPSLEELKKLFSKPEYRDAN